MHDLGIDKAIFAAMIPQNSPQQFFDHDRLMEDLRPPQIQHEIPMFGSQMFLDQRSLVRHDAGREAGAAHLDENFLGRETEIEQERGSWKREEMNVTNAKALEDRLQFLFTEARHAAAPPSGDVLGHGDPTAVALRRREMLYLGEPGRDELPGHLVGS